MIVKALTRVEKYELSLVVVLDANLECVRSMASTSGIRGG